VLREFVDGDALAAIKVGFASMLRSETRTLLARLRAAPGPDEARRLLEGALEVLARLHQAPRPERVQLFRRFTYRAEYGAATLERARAIAGGEAPEVADLARFYGALDRFLDEDPHEVAVAMIHGDLNLANLLQDEAGNTWLIDYYWTGLGPVIQDMAKLENDVRFVAFEAEDATGRREAAVGALRAYHERTLGGAPDERACRIAALRYAAHTLSFDECSPGQKRAALAAAAEHARALLA
jgi:aminoglycoside phosphotransferase (APT) family kinase protein